MADRSTFAEDFGAARDTEEGTGAHLGLAESMARRGRDAYVVPNDPIIPLGLLEIQDVERVLVEAAKHVECDRAKLLFEPGKSEADSALFTQIQKALCHDGFPPGKVGFEHHPDMPGVSYIEFWLFSRNELRAMKKAA